jgi:hypothetical protein
MPIVAAKALPLRDIERWMKGGNDHLDAFFRIYEKVWFISIMDHGSRE